MTEREIIEGNKLIAKFMGNDVMVTWHDASGKGWNSMVGIDKIDNYEKVFLQYHTSWDWLMSVVEKIESMDYSVTITGKFCEIGFLDESTASGKTKIEAVWQAVIQFINYYNTTKQ